MNLWIRCRYLFVCIAVILIAFVTISIVDVMIAIANTRFYSNAAFVVTFGVGGVFAALVGYVLSIEKAVVKDGTTRWSLIVLMISFGLLFFFVFSEIEGGEYRIPFKAYGAMLALTSLIFTREKWIS